MSLYVESREQAEETWKPETPANACVSLFGSVFRHFKETPSTYFAGPWFLLQEDSVGYVAFATRNATCDQLPYASLLTTGSGSEVQAHGFTSTMCQQFGYNEPGHGCCGVFPQRVTFIVTLLIALILEGVKTVLEVVAFFVADFKYTARRIGPVWRDRLLAFASDGVGTCFVVYRLITKRPVLPNVGEMPLPMAFFGLSVDVFTCVIVPVTILSHCSSTDLKSNWKLVMISALKVVKIVYIVTTFLKERCCEEEEEHESESDEDEEERKDAQEAQQEAALRESRKFAAANDADLPTDEDSDEDDDGHVVNSADHQHVVKPGHAQGEGAPLLLRDGEELSAPATPRAHALPPGLPTRVATAWRRLRMPLTAHRNTFVKRHFTIMQSYVLLFMYICAQEQYPPPYDWHVIALLLSILLSLMLPIRDVSFDLHRNAVVLHTSFATLPFIRWSRSVAPCTIDLPSKVPPQKRLCGLLNALHGFQVKGEGFGRNWCPLVSNYPVFFFEHQAEGQRKMKALTRIIRYLQKKTQPRAGAVTAAGVSTAAPKGGGGGGLEEGRPRRGSVGGDSMATVVTPDQHKVPRKRRTAADTAAALAAPAVDDATVAAAQAELARDKPASAV